MPNSYFDNLSLSTTSSYLKSSFANDREIRQSCVNISSRHSPTDSRTCSDSPCFPGAECTDTEVDVDTIDFEQVDSVRSFNCGDCPSGHTGDGIDCAREYILSRLLAKIKLRCLFLSIAIVCWVMGKQYVAIPPHDKFRLKRTVYKTDWAVCSSNPLSWTPSRTQTQSEWVCGFRSVGYLDAPQNL